MQAETDDDCVIPHASSAADGGAYKVQVEAGPALMSTTCWHTNKECHARLSSAFKEVVDNALSLNSEVRVDLLQGTKATGSGSWRAQGPFLRVETDTFVDDLSMMFNTGHYAGGDYGRHNLKGIGSKLFQAKLGPPHAAAELLIISVDLSKGEGIVGRFGPSLDANVGNNSIFKAVCSVNLATELLDFNMASDVTTRAKSEDGLLANHPFAVDGNRQATAARIMDLVIDLRESTQRRGQKRGTRFFYWNLSEVLQLGPARHITHGARVEGNYGNKGIWHPGTALMVHSGIASALVHSGSAAMNRGGATAYVAYDDGDNELFVPLKRVRPLAYGDEPHQGDPTCEVDVVGELMQCPPLDEDETGAEGGDQRGSMAPVPDVMPRKRLTCPDDLIDELAASYLPPDSGLFPVLRFGDHPATKPARVVAQGIALDLGKDSPLAQLKAIADRMPSHCQVSEVISLQSEGLDGIMVACWPPFVASGSALTSASTRISLHKNAPQCSGTYFLFREKVINAQEPQKWFDMEVLSDKPRGTLSLNVVAAAANERTDGLDGKVFNGLIAYLGLPDAEALKEATGLDWDTFRTWKPKKRLFANLTLGALFWVRLNEEAHGLHLDQAKEHLAMRAGGEAKGLSLPDIVYRVRRAQVRWAIENPPPELASETAVMEAKDAMCPRLSKPKPLSKPEPSVSPNEQVQAAGASSRSKRRRTAAVPFEIDDEQAFSRAAPAIGAKSKKAANAGKRAETQAQARAQKAGDALVDLLHQMEKVVPGKVATASAKRPRDAEQPSVKELLAERTRVIRALKEWKTARNSAQAPKRAAKAASGGGRTASSSAKQAHASTSQSPSKGGSSP
mmetsp:Transcript_13943/g.42191  ORF Transcript_13943/g.42191 Transcript_13943/m.42191 type:complete len:848 (+) Transcript_13943:97-2640(+)